MDFLNFLTHLYQNPSWTELGDGSQAALQQAQTAPTPPAQRINPTAAANLAREFQGRFNTPGAQNPVQDLRNFLNQHRQERETLRATINREHQLDHDATRSQAIDAMLNANDNVLRASFLMAHTASQASTINPQEMANALHEFNQSLSDYLTSLQRMGDAGPRSVLLPTATLVNTYSYVMRPTLALVQLLQSRIPVASRENPALAAELRSIAVKIQDCWRLMAHVVEANPQELSQYLFLREYALGQMDLIQMTLGEGEEAGSNNPGLSHSARIHLQNASTQSAQIIQSQNPAPNSDLGFFSGIVQSYSVRNVAILPPLPTPTEAAREVITANTLSFISTICQEIDHSHGTAAEVMSERYTRFQMVMNAMLAVQPHLNLREAMTRLQNLRWNDQLYNHMQGWITRHNQDPAHAQAQISFQTVIESLENANHPLHGEVIRQIESFVERNRNNPHHQNISTQNLNHPTNGALTLLKGSQTLHAMLPLLARSLHGALASMPANSPDRAVLLNFFRSTAEREDPSREPFERGKQEIIVALFSANQQEPSPEALARFRNSGHEERVNGRPVNQARAFVDNLIDFIQHRSLDQNHLQENLTRARRIQIHPALPGAEESNQFISRFAVNDPDIRPPQIPIGLLRNAVPPWLLALQRETYTAPTRSSAEQNNQSIIQNLREVAVALEEGRILSETDSSAQGYERNYMNLIAFVSAAGANGGIRNSDGAHVGTDLEHIQRILRTDNRGIFDDSHALLDDLLNHDAQALNGRNNQNLGVIVNSWAERVLNTLHHHDNNWRANAIHRNERHPASFHAIWQSFAGSTPHEAVQNANSLAHQLATYHLQNSTLAPHIQQRAQTELHSSHGFRDFIMAFGTVDNLVLTGVMAGSAQWANRSLQASPAVLTGTRIGLTDLLLQSAARMRWYNPVRWVTRVGASATGWAGRHPPTAAFAFSLSAGGLYAAHRDEYWRQYNNEHPNDRHEFNRYEDWARNTAILFGVSSPLWYPAYFNRMRTLQLWGYRDSGAWRFLAPYNWDWRVKVGSTAAFTVGGGLLVNHWRPHHPRWENLLYGCAGALAIASPLALSAHPLPIQVIEGSWGSRVGAGSTTLGTVAENGRIGFAGHMLVGGASGLAGGLAASSLVAARDGVNGYETHFWRDMAQSTTTLGVAMTANAAVGALYSVPGRALRSWQTRGIENVQAAELARAEREIQTVINRSAGAQRGLGLVHSLASASVATVGMLITEAEMHALQHNHLYPYRSDWGAVLSAESIATTNANLLAFEGMNAAMSRLRMVNLLGRPRATQIDHITNRLLQDVNFANPAERNTTRDFVRRRLAVESLRGRDLSQIAREENIRQWRADFNNGRVLLASRGDASTHTSIPQTHLPQSTINNLASQALLHEGAASPPDIRIHIDKRNGNIHPEIPAGESLDHYATIHIGFSGGRVHLSENTQAELRQLSTELRLNSLAAELLARHGAPVTLNPAAVTLAGIIRGIRAEQLRDQTSLFVTETESENSNLRTVQDVERALHAEQAKEHPDRSRLRTLGEQMNYFVNRQTGIRLLARVEVDGQMYDIYRGTLEMVPEGRRRHRAFEMTIPGIHNPSPTIRPGRIAGLYDRWLRSQPNLERIHLLPQSENGQWTALPEAWRNLLNHFENDTINGQAIEMRAQVTGMPGNPLREANYVYHVGRSQVFNADSFIPEIRPWLPTGFGMNLQRHGENDWILHNFSTRDGITLQVNGNEVARGRQFTVNHGDVIKIPAGKAADGSPRFVEITLDLQHSGTSAPAPVVAPEPETTATTGEAARPRRHLPVIQNNTGTAPAAAAAPATPEPAAPQPRAIDVIEDPTLLGDVPGDWLDARFHLQESLRAETARYILVEVRINGDRIELVKIGQDEERATLTAGPNQIVLDRQNEFERVREGDLSAISEENKNALRQIFPEADPDPTHGRNPQILASFARRSAAVDRLRQALDLANDGRFQITQSGDNYLVSETAGTDINSCLGILEVRNQEVHLYTRATGDTLADLRSALNLRYNIPRSGKTLEVHHEAPPLPTSGGSGGPGNFPSEPTAPVAPRETNAGAGGRMQLPQAALDALAEFFIAPPETPASEPARLEERREVRAPAPASVARDPATDIAQWPPYSITPEQVPQNPHAVFDFLRNLRAEPDYSQSHERLLIPEMLEGSHVTFTRPTRAIQVDGYTFFLSPLIRSSSRDYVLGMVPVRENGHFVLKRRIFYKSLSDGAGWRCPPYVSNGFLGKGDHYVASTQVVPALAEALDQILAERGARSSESTPDLSPEDFANFRDLGTPLQGFTVARSAAGAELGTLTHVHHRPAEQVRISFLEELSRYRPAHVFSYNNTAIQGAGYGPYRAIDPAKAERQVQEILALNSRYPEGFIPDFSQTPQRTHQTQHPYLGEVTLRDYSAILQTATGQRPLIWTLAQDNQGRSWCANIRYADSPINSYGVPSEIFDGGILISKPLEYDEQVAGLPERYQRPILNPVTGERDYTYTDMTPFLHELEPIRRFRIAQGLERGTTSTAQAVTSSMQLRTQNSEMQYTPEEEQAPRAASIPARVTTPPQGTPIVPPLDQPAPAVTRTPAFTRPLPTEHRNPSQTFILEDITTAISLDGIVIEPVPGETNEVKVYAERSPTLMGAESLSLGEELEAEITGRFIDVTYVNSQGNVGTIRIERRNHSAPDLEALADLEAIRNMGTSSPARVGAVTVHDGSPAAASLPATSPGLEARAEALPPTRVRHVAAEHHAPIAGSVSLTRGTNDSLANILRAQGIAVPDNSFLAHVRVTRMMGGTQRPYLFRVEGPVTFNLSRQGIETTSYEQSNFPGFRHGLGEPGETVILQSGSEAYTLTLQAPESRMTRAPQSRSYQGPGYFQRAANALKTWWAQRANRTQVAMPGPAAPARERRDVRAEMPAMPVASPASMTHPVPDQVNLNFTTNAAGEQECIVGRTRNNTSSVVVNLGSSVVAREQARILRVGDEYFIEDLSSDSGRRTSGFVSSNRGTYVAIGRQWYYLPFQTTEGGRSRAALVNGNILGFGSPHTTGETGSIEFYRFEVDAQGSVNLHRLENQNIKGSIPDWNAWPYPTNQNSPIQYSTDHSTDPQAQLNINGRLTNMNFPSNGIISLGRNGGGANIEISALSSISRLQARIQVRIVEGVSYYTLIDGSYESQRVVRNSSNGTYIVRHNGLLIRVPAGSHGIDLHPGDTIHIGNPQRPEGSILNIPWLAPRG